MKRESITFKELYSAAEYYYSLTHLRTVPYFIKCFEDDFDDNESKDYTEVQNLIVETAIETGLGGHIIFCLCNFVYFAFNDMKLT